MKTLVIYGSLRRGEYNYDYFNRNDEMEFVGQGKLDGFDLFNLGSYPCITPSKEQRSVVVEVFNVPDDMAERIDGMELGAGYNAKDVKIKTEDGKEVEGTVYVYRERPDEKWLLEHGDWCKREI